MGVEPAIDITAEQRRTILALLKRHLPCTTVWVYGSRAKWTSQPHSDLDMVVFATPDQSSRVSLLREAFEDSDLPFRVDLFVWNEVPDSFRKQIESDHVVLATPGGKESGAHDGWQDTNLGALIELKRGYDLPKRVRKTGSVPIVSSSGVTGHHSESKVTGPGVVTGRYGTLGQVFYIADDFWPLNTTLYVRDFKESDPRFIRYLLQDLDFSVYSDKAAVPGLNRNHLHQEPVRVPSDPSEQRAIAHILGTLDEKIDLNRRMNETLESMARTIFNDWFVNFGPTRAKAEGREPYLAAELWDLFPDALDEEDKPTGWQDDVLGSFTNLQNGYAFKSKDWKASGVPVVKIGSVKPAFVDIEKVSFIDEAFALEKANFRLSIGDMLVGLTGYVGETGRIPPTQNAPMLNQRVGRFSPNLGLESFVYSSVRCKEFGEFAESKSHGSAQANVSTKDLLAYPLPNPGELIIKAFCDIASPFFKSSLANCGQTSILDQTRDFLLPRLMSGEIRLSEAEKVVEAVA